MTISLPAWTKEFDKTANIFNKMIVEYDNMVNTLFQKPIRIYWDKKGVNEALKSIESLMTKQQQWHDFNKKSFIEKNKPTPPFTLHDKAKHASQQSWQIAYQYSQKAVKSSVQYGMTAEQNQLWYNHFLQNPYQAQQLLQDITTFSKNAPIDHDVLVQTGKDLLVVGMQAKDLVLTFTTLGNLALGDSAKFKDMANVYSKVLLNQKAGIADIDALAKDGVQIWQALENRLGMSGEELKKHVDQYGITALVFKDVLTQMTSTGGQFFNGMNEQTNTSNGKWVILMNTLNELGTKFGTLLLPTFNFVIDVLRGLGWVLMKVVDAFGFLKDLLPPLVGFLIPIGVQFAWNAIQIGNSLMLTKLQAIANATLSTSFRTLTGTMLINPLTMWIAALGLLAGAMYAVVNAGNKMESTLSSMQIAQQKALQSTQNDAANLTLLNAELKNTNAHSHERKNIINKIIAIAPELAQTLGQEKINYQQLNEQIDQYVTKSYQKDILKLYDDEAANDPETKRLKTMYIASLTDKDAYKKYAIGSYDNVMTSYDFNGMLYEQTQSEPLYAKNMIDFKQQLIQQLNRKALNNYHNKMQIISDMPFLDVPKKEVKNKKTSNHVLDKNASTPPNNLNPTTSTTPLIYPEKIVNAGEKNITISIQHLIGHIENHFKDTKEGVNKMTDDFMTAMIQFLTRVNAITR